MSKITEDELATLSDEERAALEGHEDDDPIDSVNDDDDPADDSSDPPEDKADKKDEAPAEDPPKDETPFAVPFQHRSSINMEEAGKQLEALQKQYDDGELDMAEFLSKRDEIREKIIADKLATQISEQSQDQVAAALWGQAVQNFLDSRVGAAYKGDPVLWSTLDNVVKTMAQDDANANLSDKQLIEKAHEEVAKRFRVDGAKPTVTPTSIARRDSSASSCWRRPTRACRSGSAAACETWARRKISVPVEPGSTASRIAGLLLSTERSAKAVEWLRKGAQPTDRVQKLLEVSGAWAEFKAAK